MEEMAKKHGTNLDNHGGFTGFAARINRLFGRRGFAVTWLPVVSPLPHKMYAPDAAGSRLSDPRLQRR